MNEQITEIDVACVDGTHRVAAHVYGQWAASRWVPWADDQRTDDFWVVTFIPAGRSLTSAIGLLSEQEAMHVAELLSERAPHIADWQEMTQATKISIKTIALDALG